MVPKSPRKVRAPTTEKEADPVSQALDAIRQQLTEIRSTTDKQAEEFAALRLQIEGKGSVGEGSAAPRQLLRTYLSCNVPG